MRNGSSVLLVIGFFGCAAMADDGHAHGKKSVNPGMTQLKTLIGTWVQADATGKPTDTVVSVFKLTAGGSAIQETIFPGADHEMVTVYHPDGKDLVLTHYCATGNQPRMKLDPKSPKGELRFQFAGGTNLDPAKDVHMHEGKIVILDANTIEWSWASYKDGKPDLSHQVAMKLIRKKS